MTQKRKTKPKQVPRVSAPEATKVRPVAKRIAAVTGAPERHHPAWGLSLLDLDHADSWSWAITAATLHDIRRFLANMEQLTWTEVLARKHGGGHFSHKAMPVASLCKEARDRLLELGLDDVDELFEFRRAYEERLWGIIGLDGDSRYHVFHLLWWDQHHQVYPLNS